MNTKQKWVYIYMYIYIHLFPGVAFLYICFFLGGTGSLQQTVSRGRFRHHREARRPRQCRRELRRATSVEGLGIMGFRVWGLGFLVSGLGPHSPIPHCLLLQPHGIWRSCSLSSRSASARRMPELWVALLPPLYTTPP